MNATGSARDELRNPVVADENFGYDATGNLTRDQQGQVGSVKWSVYGHPLVIGRSGGAMGEVEYIRYTYDGQGNRIGKEVKRRGQGPKEYEWYVRDGQGHALAVYRYRDSQGVLTLAERGLYGSSRLGSWTGSLNVEGANVKAEGGVVVPLLGRGYGWQTRRGEKFFELSNHLGNVLVTVSDRKTGLPSSADPGVIGSYRAEVVSVSDYYPFGMPMPGRTIHTDKYRYWMYINFSKPVLSRSGQFAIVEIDKVCYGLCGEGFTCILKNVNGKWQLYKRVERWIS